MNGYLDKTMLLSLLRRNAEEARVEADEFGGECVAYAERLEDVISDVEHFPTIDAVPVVRCAECRFSRVREANEKKKEALRCDGTQSPCFCRIVRKDYFCPRGERRND